MSPLADTVWSFRAVPSFAQGLVRDLRVRWALEEAGMHYESRTIGFEERHSEAYRRKHPFGLVPVFESGGKTLIESGAIVFAIAEQCESLMPAAHRHETLAWMFAALNTVEPPINALGAMDLQHAEAPWTPLRRPSAVEEVKARLSALCQWLGERDYLLGRFTAADILMATVLRLIRHTDIVAGYSQLDAYLKRCEARPAFQKALRNQAADYALNDCVAA